jgi:PAS domain S-box-containing protein
MSDVDRTVETRLRAAVETSPGGLLVLDASGRIVLANRGIERTFGYTRQELIGRRVELLIAERSRDAYARERAEFVENPAQSTSPHELYGLSRDGSEIPLEIEWMPTRTNDGLFVISWVVDLRARRRAETRFRVAVESCPNGMVLVDARGVMLLVNREVERMFGYTREELLGQPIEMLVPERYRKRHPRFRERFFADPQLRASGGGRELYGMRKDKLEFPCEIGLTPIDSDEGPLVLSAIVDISARKRAEDERARLEDQLRHAQKLEAVGTLAGGVAHDFNNLLGAMIGCAELARETAGSEEARRDLDELLLAAQRGRQLVRRILTFSRRQERTREVLRLEGLVAETIQLLQATLPARIDIQTRSAWDVPAVLADPTSIHQVIMNLATNAAHAMPDGGRLEIVISPLQITENDAQRLPELRPGPYARVSVRDTGCGIDPSHIDRVFEPFFTTKPPGSGSGLGLAMVRGIMREHEGTVTLQSRRRQGTVVECYFPAVLDTETEHPPTHRQMARGRGERILYIDDEEMLVRVGRRRLQSLGYQVEGEVSATAALERCMAGAAFDLVVTDYSMPRMTGLDLAHQLRRIAPDVPIILLTGFIEEIPAELIASVGIAKVILKPATWQTLAEEVRTVLDQVTQRRGALT